MEGAIVNAIAAGCSDELAVQAAGIFSRLDKSNSGVKIPVLFVLFSLLWTYTRLINLTETEFFAGDPNRGPRGTEPNGPGAVPRPSSNPQSHTY